MPVAYVVVAQAILTWYSTPPTASATASPFKAHAYFTKEEKAGRSGDVETRERVALCLDVGAATVGRVMAYWNKNPGTKFDEVQLVIKL
ncbi:hypothetical protein PR003_g18569 [Phytophthora rubi]|uniref:Uncharacterized protein n=1 Tax=Phytophthora rubi TaxID=129364 RepID=A0A6A3I9N6_9STRA|nr:hypothetical protein PR001_g26697 [Phytophthora rubi]KAE8977058.1 hypothetical protein PR002_g25132 [Phytophthora rubi]KAE9317079.1 hypothetical protein PR003_g18569 [Phytophthora rubi]